MIDPPLSAAIASVPAGRWAVGVSGGADSVALLSLLRTRNDLSLHVVHLDHQTRGQHSTDDARFTADLAANWNLPCTVAQRDEIEPLLRGGPENPSARYRELRLILYRQVVQSPNLQGVILAHHADDQAETVFQRLLRASGYAALVGMSPQTVIGGLVILRPLLSVGRDQLRRHLTDAGIVWREDASNRSPQYLRNRLRQVLEMNPPLAGELLALSAACAQLRNWARSAAPVLPNPLVVKQLARLPRILAAESARQWLIDRGVEPAEIEAAVIERLITMAADAASPPRQDFPGGVTLRRRSGVIEAMQ